MSVLLVAALAYSSLAPVPDLPDPGVSDKVEHFTAYLALALWFTGLYPRARYWIVVVALLALGGSLEVAQGLMQLGRTADIFDVAANAAGVGSGLLLALAFTGAWARRFESWLGSR
jgi:VanZ family protein